MKNTPPSIIQEIKMNDKEATSYQNGKGEKVW